MKTQITRKLASGFSLVEVLVAVGSGAVMLTAVHAAFAFGFTLVELGRQDLRATQILVEQMENLRLTRYENLRSFTTNAYFDPAGQCNGAGGAAYTITVDAVAPRASDLVPPGTVNPVVYYINALRKITVTATWTNANILRTRTLQTYAAKNGVQGYVYAPK